MDWCKVFMWIASICVLTAMVGERFLPQIVVVALAFGRAKTIKFKSQQEE